MLPLGVFLVLHLWMNARALWGDAAFASTVDAMHRSRALTFVEVAFVFAPLLVHGLIGLRLAVEREPLVVPSPYTPWTLAAMRASGVVVAAFLVMHLFDLRFRATGARLGGGELGTLLAAGLSSTSAGVPWRGVAYLVAVACTAFHFAAGSWGFYARSRQGQGSAGRLRWAATGAGVVGVALTLGYADVVVFHATGARLIGGKAAGERAPKACP